MNIISKNNSAQEVRVLRDAQVYTTSPQSSTASYVDLAGSKVDAGASSSLAMTVLSTHATLTVKYKILASIDDVSYVEVQAEATLAAVSGLGSYSIVNPPFRYYKAQIIDGSGHGTATGTAIIKN